MYYLFRESEDIYPKRILASKSVAVIIHSPDRDFEIVSYLLRVSHPLSDSMLYRRFDVNIVRPLDHLSSMVIGYIASTCFRFNFPKGVSKPLTSTK